MSARDTFHQTVKQALVKDGWLNVAPLTLKYGTTKLEIDLCAERLFTAQKGQVQIAVEVKSFSASSIVYEFHQAIGQYMNYRMVLKRLEPQRIPYLSIPIEIYERFFGGDFFQDSLDEHRVNLLLVNTVSEEIIQWIPKPELL